MKFVRSILEIKQSFNSYFWYYETFRSTYEQNNKMLRIEFAWIKMLPKKNILARFFILIYQRFAKKISA